MAKRIIALLALAALAGVAICAWQNMENDEANGDRLLTLHGNVEIRQVSLAFNLDSAVDH